MSNRPARLEIFGRDFTLKDKATVNFPKYEYDYLSVGDGSVTVPKILKADEQDYIIIIGLQGKIQGVISEVEYKNNTTEIKIRTFLEMLDVDIYYDLSGSNKKSLEEILAEMISQTYISSGDDEQNIPGMMVFLLTETYGMPGMDSEEVNIYEVCTDLLKRYRIAVNFNIFPAEQMIRCTIGIPQASIKTIECGLRNIITAEIVLKEKSKAYNKVIIIGKYDDEKNAKYGQIEKRIYYLDGDGNVTQNPESRVLPVLWKLETMSIDDEFETKAYEKAVSQLTPKGYNNYIKIEVRNNDPLIRREMFEIGQEGRIIQNGVEYISIFTGYESDKTTVLYFGTVRTEFTKNIRRYRK